MGSVDDIHGSASKQKSILKAKFTKTKTRYLLINEYLFASTASSTTEGQWDPKKDACKGSTWCKSHNNRETDPMSDH